METVGFLRTKFIKASKEIYIVPIPTTSDGWSVITAAHNIWNDTCVARCFKMLQHVLKFRKKNALLVLSTK